MRNNELTGEPAVWASLIASGVQLGAAFWLPLSNDQVNVINAAVLALAGVWVAWATRSTDNGGSIKAAVLGGVQALISLAVAFGWQVAPEQTVAITGFVGLLVAVFLRQTSTPKSVSAVR